MTSDHQAIDTMHTPLPNQQQVNAKDLHKVCNDVEMLSMADGDCHQHSSSDHSPRSVAQNIANGDNLEPAANGTLKCMPMLPWWFGPDCEKHLSAMNGVVVFGKDEDEEETVEMSGPHEDRLRVSGAGNIDGARFISSPTLNETNEQFSSFGVNCSTGVPVLSSRFSSMDGQLAGGVALISDGVPTQGGPWPGYDLSYEDLKTSVRRQLEFYFSRENLAGDAYLRSQMDNDQFVKVSVLANFNMVKRLTTDMEIILQAMRESPHLQLDDAEEKVRPIHKRCTLILREIPDGTEQKEVEDLFASPACPKISGCEYALNNIWYVNFETDEDAQKAFLYLRQQVQSFKGKPILARIKTAPIPRVQNGYRPVPPNTLSLQGTQHLPTSVTDPTPDVVAALLSPVADTTTSPLSLPAATVCTPVGTTAIVGPAAPGDGGCVVVSSNPVTLGGGAGIPLPNLPPSNIYYYSASAGQPAAIMAATTGHAPAVVATPAAAAVLSPTWPPTAPTSFDLGYILAVNGYQPQGAYRPALLVPAAPIPAQVAAAVGHRFVTERSGRKSRSGGNYYSTHAGDHSANNSVDNGRSTAASSYNHYGSTANGRGGGGGGYGEGKAPFYRNDQNIHYNSIRNRPSRQSATSGVTNSNGFSSRRYGSRNNGDRFFGADYWRAGTKDRKTMPGSSSTALVTGGPTTPSADGKRSDGFDLQSSSFPPLPTTTAADQGEDPPAASDSSLSVPAAAQKLVPVNVNTQCEQSASDGQTPSQSPSTAKVRPRMQQRMDCANGLEMSDRTIDQSPPPRHRATTNAARDEDHSQTICSGSTSNSINSLDSTKMASSFPQDSQMRDQKTVYKHTNSAAGAVVRGGTNSTIPVAVVPPNAQPKPQRVITTVDKGTVTDTPISARKGDKDERSSSIGTMTNLGDAVSAEDKANYDLAKRLSYADMAKHAAARAAAANSGISFGSSVAERTGGNANGSGQNSGGKETRGRNEDGGRRRGSSRSGTGGFPSQGRQNQPGESSTKYASRKQSKHFRNRDYQQHQDYASVSYQDTSPTPSTS